MKVERDVVCVIPARSGSKRIRDKNLQEVGGRTLLQRAISTANEAFGVAIVSTDDERYADHARDAGALVPALRPVELARDDSTTDEVVRHALLEWCGPEVQVVAVVQPTSPFTSADDIIRTVEGLRTTPDAATALTGARVPPAMAYVLCSSPEGLSHFVAPRMRRTRTQQLPALHVPTGGVYAAPAQRLRSGGPLVKEPIFVVEVPAARALDVDDEHDLHAARIAAG